MKVPVILILIKVNEFIIQQISQVIQDGTHKQYIEMISLGVSMAYLVFGLPYRKIVSNRSNSTINIDLRDIKED